MAHTCPLKNDRRKNLRIIYRKSENPLLKIGKNEYEVADLNEKGMGVNISDMVDMEKNIMGLVVFKNGETIGVEGHLVWRNNNKIGIEFVNPLPAEVIVREHMYRSEGLKEE